MTRYGGTKALDAEITINFEDNSVLMDYSTVKGAARMFSDDAVVLFSEWDALPARTRWRYAALASLIAVLQIFFVLPLYMRYFTTLVNYGIIKSAEAQYDHQNLLRYVYTHLYGMTEHSASGELKEDKLAIPVANNLFISYKLDGEYKEKIRSISLVRRYSQIKRFGVFRETRQNGWNLIFEFTEPPKDGSCIVENVG